MRFLVNIALLIVSLIGLQQVSTSASDPIIPTQETLRKESATEFIRQVRQHTAATLPYSFENLVLSISSYARTAVSQSGSRFHHHWQIAFAWQAHTEETHIDGGLPRPQTVTIGIVDCTPSRLCRWII